MSRKVAILPCNGVGNVVATIARQAGYRVCEDLRPQDTFLVCLPQLVKGNKKHLEAVQNCPVVLIEGCVEHCGVYALAMKNCQPAANIFIPEILKKTGRRIKKWKGTERRKLTENEWAIVEAVVKETVEKVDQLK